MRILVATFIIFVLLALGGSLYDVAGWAGALFMGCMVALAGAAFGCYLASIHFAYSHRERMPKRRVDQIAELERIAGGRPR